MMVCNPVEGLMTLTVDLVSALPVFGMEFKLGTVLGMLGVGFTLASFAVKRMAALRTLSLIGSVCFIFYGFIEWQLPSIALNVVLIPLNVIRLWELTRLSKEIEQATRDSPVTQWLLPHMRRRAFKAGEVLFRKGDVADRLIYVTHGELTLSEIGQRIGPGELIGEIGLFSPDKKRTQTVVCATDGERYEMTDEMIYRLYYQHPKLGFHLMRLVAGRLLKDVQRRDNTAPA
jgi:CRP/FNR family transcriptional regulator, cyclic AMP receptor protein